MQTTTFKRPIQHPLIRVGIFIYGAFILFSITFYVLATVSIRDEISLSELADAINRAEVQRIYVYQRDGETFLTAEIDGEDNVMIVEGALAGTSLAVPLQALTAAGADRDAISAVTFTPSGEDAPHSSQDLLRTVRDALVELSLPMSVVSLFIVLALIRYKNSLERDMGPPRLPARTSTPPASSQNDAQEHQS